jgi:protoheme IX farnesyltransferase
MNGIRNLQITDGNRIKSYIEISKPKLVLLLYFTSFSSMAIASSLYGFDWVKILLVSLAITLSVSGSNATTAFIDKDMDIVMQRTNQRPVPSGKIYPPRNALIYGLVLVFIGITIAGFINYLSAIFIFLGFLDSAVIYNVLTKKKSPFNIILGAPAGGMPVLAGWAAIANKIDLIAIFMFIMVIVWTPMHIWSLAYFYKEDYKKANVPMLPVIWSDGKVFALLSVLNFILVIFSILLGFLNNFSIIYIIISIIFGLAIIIFGLLLIIKRQKKYAWLLFKFSSPYLAVVFLLLMIEYILI